jgi:hypothetical protein
MNQYWVIERKSTIEDSKGHSRVIQDWWRSTTRFKSLEDALKEFTIEDCEYDERKNNCKFETSIDEHGCVVLKGTTIMTKSGDKASSSDAKKWYAKDDRFDGFALCMFAKFFLLNEDNMTMEDLETLRKRFTYL